MVKLPVNLTREIKRWNRVRKLIDQASHECGVDLLGLECWIYPGNCTSSSKVGKSVEEFISAILKCEKESSQTTVVYNGRKLSRRTVCILRAIDNFKSKEVEL